MKLGAEPARFSVNATPQSDKLPHPQFNCDSYTFSTFLADTVSADSGDSARGIAALTCSLCSSNPWHRPGTACFPQPKYAEVCPMHPTCSWQTVEAWRDGASAGTAAPSVRMDLLQAQSVHRDRGGRCYWGGGRHRVGGGGGGAASTEGARRRRRR